MNLPINFFKRSLAPLLFTFTALLALALYSYFFYQKKIIQQNIFGVEIQAGSAVFSLYLYDILSFIVTVFLTALSLKLIFSLLAETRKNQRISDHLYDKNEILSMASHELYAPLANIKNTLSILVPQLSDEYYKFATRAIESCEQLIKLIDDLLIVSRFEMGKIKLTKESSSVTDLCEEVVKQFSILAKNAGVALTCVNPTEMLPKVDIDKERIRGVLTNFIGNAIKYSNSDGEIKVRTDLKGRELMVSVSDNGPGISPPDLTRLFHRFARGTPPERTGQHQGSGLGLYISRLIIEAHKGKIGARSREGKGSTFYFSLPLSS